MASLYFRVLRESKLFIVLTLVLCSLLSIGVFYIQINPNNRVFFADSQPRYYQLLSHEQRFGANTTLFFMVSQKGIAGYQVDWISPLVWLESELNEIASVTKVASMASIPYLFGVGDSLVTKSYFDVACPSRGCDLSKMAKLADPSYRGRYISRDSDALSVVASIDIAREDGSAITKISGDYYRIEREFSAKFPDFELSVTGAIPMMNAFYTAARQDSSILLPIAVVLIFFVLFLLVRKLLLCAILLTSGILSVFTVVGTVGWLGIPLNTATATVPLVIFTVAVASVMHPLMRLISALEGDWSGYEARVLNASFKNFKPSLLSAATTMFGFLSMSTVSSPPVADLGMMAAFGVAISFLTSMFGIPWLLLVGKKIFHSSAFSAKYHYDTHFGLIAWKLRKATEKYSVAVMIAATLIATYGVSRFSFQEDFVEYFGSENAFRVDTEAVAGKFADPYYIELEVSAGLAEGVFDPGFREALELLHSRLESKEEVVSVYSVLNVFRNLEESLGTANGNSSEALAQYFMVYELSLPRGYGSGDLVDADRAVATVSILLRDLDMSRIRSIVEEIDSWAPDLQDIEVTVTGEAVPTAYLSEETIREMLVGIAISVLLSAILIAVVIRRSTVAIVMILASLLPTLFGFGIWGMLGGDVGMSATLVIATTIGLVIDDTIHLLVRYFEEIRDPNVDYFVAEARALAVSSPAIISTSVAMAAGFLVLSISDFEMNRVFGFCSVLVTLTALGFNIVCTPALMTWAAKAR